MSKSIKKKTEAIAQQEAELKIGHEKLKCDCNHKKGEQTDFTKSSKYSPSNLAFICTQCRKELHLNKISDSTALNSLETVDNMIDVIKLSLNPKVEKDAKELDRLSKVQFMVRNKIFKQYKKSLSGSDKKRGNTSRESAWGRPRSN